MIWSPTTGPAQTLCSAETQAAGFPKPWGFLVQRTLIELSSESTGCLLPLPKSGADLPPKAAPGSGSNVKQPLPPIAAAAPSCRCHLFCCHVHPGTTDQEDERHPMATLLEWHPGIRWVAGLWPPVCTQFGHRWESSASLWVGRMGEGGVQRTFERQIPWELLSPWEGPKRSGLICLFAFSLLLATSQ